MRHSFVSVAILALTSGVFSQTAKFDALSKPTQDQQVPAGSTLDIVWEDSSATYPGKVTIQLLQGETPSTLSQGEVVASGIDQTLGTYAWSVPTDLKNYATFGFTITLDSNTSIFQYSYPFQITGLSGSDSSSAVQGSATSTKTIQLSTGTAYSTPSSSSSSSSSSSFSASPTATPSSTTLVIVTSSPSSTAATNASTTYQTQAITPTTTGKTSSTSSASASVVSTVNTGAAAGNAVTGSFVMIGGLVLALAL